MVQGSDELAKVLDKLIQAHDAWYVDDPHSAQEFINIAEEVVDVLRKRQRPQGSTAKAVTI